MRTKLGLCLAAVAIGLTAAPAVAASSFPDPTGYLVDASHAVPDQDEQALESELSAYATRSGHQLAVAVVPTAGGNIDNYANDLFGKWGVGSKQRDDGVLIVVATSDRQLRIEVGRGLEGDLTDLESAAIIRDDMVPALKAGNVTEAVRAGERGVRRALGDPTPDAAGDASAAFNGFGGGAPRAQSSGGSHLFPLLLFGFVAFAFLSRLGRRRGRRRRGGGMLFPLFLGSGFGGGFGGGGYGGGGFGGGGGGFGGFGGGSSGGGGASGSW